MDERDKRDISEKITGGNDELNKDSIPGDINAEDEKKISDKSLIIGAFIIIILFGIIIGSFFIFKSQPPKTIEDLHLLNIKGKLSPDKGYMYKGVYSFVTIGDEWYTQLSSPSGVKLYDLAFRYSPRDLEDIEIEGFLNTELFNNKKAIYVTFDPAGGDYSHVALAVGDFDTHMIKAFGKEIIAACDKNESGICETRPIINCTNTKEPVLYVKTDKENKVLYNDNCIIVQGNEFELVRGIDRVLLQFYNVMD